MNFPPKIEGQPCDKGCGGKNVKNPKTGKIFCENKCWLKGDTSQSNEGQPQNVPQPTNNPETPPQGQDSSQNSDKQGSSPPDKDKIISRCAIAKSFVQAGANMDVPETYKIMNKCVDWVLDGTIPEPEVLGNMAFN